MPLLALFSLCRLCICPHTKGNFSEFLLACQLFELKTTHWKQGVGWGEMLGIDQPEGERDRSARGTQAGRLHSA